MSVTPTVWWHSADEPTLIVGAAQRASEIDLEACKIAGVHVVQRQAGGAAVYASPDVLGLDVALPPEHPLVKPDVVESYRWLGHVWTQTMRSLGVDARMVDIEEARRGRQASTEALSALRTACFGTLSPFEVVAGDRKLVGLAQVRRHGAELLQSAVHLRFDADTLVQLLALADRTSVSNELNRVAVGLCEVTERGRSVAQVIEAFERTLEDQMRLRLVDGELTELELTHLDDRVSTGMSYAES